MSDEAPRMGGAKINERGNLEVGFHAKEQEHEANWGCYSCLHWVQGEQVKTAIADASTQTYNTVLSKMGRLKGRQQDIEIKAKLEADKILASFANLDAARMGRLGLCRNLRRTDIGAIHFTSFYQQCVSPSGGSYYEGRAKADGGTLTVLNAEEANKRGLDGA